MSKTIKFRKVNKLSDIDFRRVVGVTRDTFKKMQKVVNRHYKDKRSKGGTSRSLSPSDELLLMLEYYREYRTYKHLAVDYEVSESTAHYIVRKMEKILIEHPEFHLETLKHIEPKDAQELEITVVDVTESQCERPKKSKNITTQARRKSIP